MIQVCSRCGTRWNVRDRQRGWCPRCNGALLAPTTAAGAAAPPRDPNWAPQHAHATSGPVDNTQQRLPVGYRWIAVRPGAGPPPRRRRPPLGPTPRYTSIPRWGLHQHWDSESGQFGLPAPTPAADGPTPRFLRVTMLVTGIVFAAAALVYLVRYALLLVNRSTLLNTLVATLVEWGAITVSVLALFAMFFLQIAMAFWLVGRRAAAFARVGHPETRQRWQLFCGCLIPIVNLFFAPVFVIELAAIEARQRDLRRPIVTWWVVWVLSFLLSSFASITALPFITDDMQGAADNTLLTAVAYLVALIALVLFRRVFLGFEATPVERPIKRWVVLEQSPSKGGAEISPASESVVPVESERRDPAA